MKNIVELTWEQIKLRSAGVASKILADFNGKITWAFPVPNGGIPAALSIQAQYNLAATAIGFGAMLITDDPERATVILDDIIDSGSTRQKFASKPFYALAEKATGRDFPRDAWVSFPWERMKKEEGPEDNIRRLLQFIGENPEREGLIKTPQRVAKAYKEMFSGYSENPEDMLTVFEDGACDEQVILRRVEFVSHCEHHMLPFFGHADIAYVPNKRVIGVSKLARLLEVYSKRLQIQERLCQQVTSALDTHLQTKGSACILTAKHLCMVCRGIRKQHSEMITSSLTGIYRTDTAARLELLSLLKD